MDTCTQCHKKEISRKLELLRDVWGEIVEIYIRIEDRKRRWLRRCWHSERYASLFRDLSRPPLE